MFWEVHFCSPYVLPFKEPLWEPALMNKDALVTLRNTSPQSALQLLFPAIFQHHHCLFTGQGTLSPALCSVLFYGIISFSAHDKEAASAVIHILERRKLRSGVSEHFSKVA